MLKVMPLHATDNRKIFRSETIFYEVYILAVSVKCQGAFDPLVYIFVE